MAVNLSMPNTSMVGADGKIDQHWHAYFAKLTRILNQLDTDNDGKVDQSDFDSLDLKPMPEGDIVGTTDTQTVTNKTISDCTIDDSNAITLREGITVVNPDVRWLVTLVDLDPAAEDYTLTEEEYKSLVILVKDAQAGSVVSLPNEEGRFYFVVNQSTANAVLMQAIGGSAGQIVAKSNMMGIYHDGTDYVYMMDGIAYTP